MTESEKKQERIAYWISTAQYDIETAEAMLKTERLLYVGFMCHQAIEKTLKACYVNSRQGVPPYSHNLRHLASESGMFEHLSEEQNALLNMLEPLNIESRYPDYKKKIFSSLTIERCKVLLEQTRELSQWLRNRL